MIIYFIIYTEVDLFYKSI